MSLPTFGDARDEMLAMFREYWNAQTPALNIPPGQPVPVEWPGVDSGFPPPTAAPWARITPRHGRSRQITFGPPGQRRFLRPGVVSIQVFAPISAGGGLSLAERLGIIARDAFEGRGTATGILFRNSRIHEVGRDGAWHQMNVTVEFEYDEMR